ncbi:MAG: hypothetical protein KC619_30230 [Myxococcales bacterium]|nr:hypothetical protein [Myxococcales bacterium]
MRNVADIEGDPFVLVVSPRTDEELEALVGPELRAFGRAANVVRTGADAQALVEHCDVLGVLIDPELVDMSPYDLCGWIRARFRDLPLMVMETPQEVDTRAVHLSPGGGVWTISESLRARMTDPSVLHGVLESIPEPDVEQVAMQTGQTVEETEEALREVLGKCGFETHRELRFHVRNLPRDYVEREDRGEVIVRFEPGPIPRA